MNNIANLELWVKSLRAYRDLYGYGDVIIRVGTTPILDLVILEQVDSSMMVWYVYDQGSIDDDTWSAILALPDYQDRLNVATASYITQQLTGWHADMLDDAWVMSVDPRPANK